MSGISVGHKFNRLIEGYSPDRPWAGPFPRCRVRLPREDEIGGYFGRCDQKPHGDIAHALERGFEQVLFWERPRNRAGDQS